MLCPNCNHPHSQVIKGTRYCLSCGESFKAKRKKDTTLKNMLKDMRNRINKHLSEEDK